jgi:hypothetical protein
MFIAGDNYFDYVVARDIFPQTLIGIFTVLFIILVICYVIYIVKVFKRVLNINQSKNTEEK